MHSPPINHQHVQDALDALLYTSTPFAPNPLGALQLVDAVLANPDVPQTSRAREMALHHILVLTITDNFTQQRILVHRSPPVSAVTKSDALAALAQDSRDGTYDLIGWSTLYYRYVAVHLDLAPDDISASLHVESRTIRRYQQHGVRRLTEALIAAEWQARQTYRQHRLLRELGATAAVTVFGREDAFAELHQVFNSPPPRHVYVSGASGIGKTTLVQEFLRAHIETGQVAHIIWISQPESLADVRQQVVARLLPENSTITLQDSFALYPVVIVLDSIESLLADPDALSALLVTLAGAAVLLLHYRYQPLSTTHRHIRLNDLDYPATAALVRDIVRHDLQATDELTSTLTSIIWHSVGGHPLAVRLLTRNIEFLDFAESADVEILERIYAGVFAHLSSELAQAWLLCALLPPGDIALETLYLLWDSIDSAAFAELSRRHLVERESMQDSVCRLATSARRYLETRLRDDPATRSLIAPHLVVLDAEFALRNPAAEPVVAYLLNADWLTLDPAQRHHWSRSLWNASPPTLEAGRVLHEDTDTGAQHLEAQRAEAETLRRMGAWDDAKRVLQQLVMMAGQQGRFVEQARALLDVAVLERLQGDYDSCAVRLDKAERAAARYATDDLLQRVRLERAQLSIDQGDFTTALRLLDSIPATLRSLALQSEAWLQAGDYERAHALASDALLHVPPEDTPSEARLYVLRGRIAFQAGFLEAARFDLLLAVSRLELLSDAFALARAQSSLGAVLMQVGDFASAQVYLEEADRIQHLLGDQTGLAATRHNLTILRIQRTHAGSPPTDDEPSG